MSNLATEQDYPPGWYVETMADDRKWPSLNSDLDCEVCVIGAGLAGLTTALELARAGKQVVVVEANRVAWGASGRNGGFVLPGFALGIGKIKKMLGTDHARHLYRLSVDGVDYVRQELTRIAPEALIAEGDIHISRIDDADGMERYRDAAARDFNHELTYLSTGQVRRQLLSERYHQGLSDPTSFHIHPLNYTRALASAAVDAGARIFENSPATGLEPQVPVSTVHCRDNRISAGHVVLAVSSYDRMLYPKLGRTVLPIATYIAATEPLGDHANFAIKTRAAISDSRRAGDYYRLVSDNRILWGGRITTRTSHPPRLAQRLYRDMLVVYPQLSGVQIQHAWSGLMGYCRHFMPIIGELEPGIWSAVAFGGHGLNTTAMAGQLISRAIAAGDDEWRLFTPFGPGWAGGPLGRVATQATYWFMQARDLLDETKNA